MGRFWAIFFMSVRFVRKVLCDGCGGAGERRARSRGLSLGTRVCAAFDRWSADPRCGQRDATGGAFLASVVPPARRSARSRRPQESGILRDDAAVRVSRWAHELLARGPRAARSLCKSKS